MTGNMLPPLCKAVHTRIIENCGSKVYTPDMTVLLIGNSLTAGNLGIPYSRYLKFPEYTGTENRIINRGLDGDTLIGVLDRLRKELSSNIPDILVVQTGANDILLPEMTSRGPKWKEFTESMIQRGSIPTTNPAEFRKIYTSLISMAVSRGIDAKRIICVTIPPIGENLHSDRNRKRTVFNQAIRNAAELSGAVIADTAQAFEEILRENPNPSEWFFGSPEDFTADVKEVRRGKGAMGLSEERGLMLTMDGAHLNERGARLMGEVISSAIAMEAVPRRER